MQFVSPRQWDISARSSFSRHGRSPKLLPPNSARSSCMSCRTSVATTTGQILRRKSLKAILFFHPAVWFIESRLTLEREIACDDAVLEANFAPRAYAESLVSLAEKSFLRRGLQLAQAAVSHVEQLRLRLVEILRKDKSQQRRSGLKRPALVLLSIALMVGGYGAANAPRLVSFSDSSQVAQAAARQRNELSVPQARLQSVNLRYEVPTEPSPRSG